MTAKVLVAGVGNLLLRDDGFGVEVALRLSARGDLPPGVRVTETGLGGVGLVQDLMDGYEGLLVLDVVKRGGSPGTLYLLEPRVDDLQSWSTQERHTFLADLHRAEPSRALVLARALGVLPPRVLILACEPADVEEAAIGLTAPVERAACLAVERVRALIQVLMSTDAQRLTPAAAWLAS
jgi:hydrogenase maturation protease